MSQKRLQVALIAAAVAALGLGATALAQSPRAGERIVGYSVDSHTQYVLIEQPNGGFKSCRIQRQTALRTSPAWECTTLPAIP